MKVIEGILKIRNLFKRLVRRFFVWCFIGFELFPEKSMGLQISNEPNTIPKIFVINLPRSVKRRAFMEEQLGKLSLPYEWVEGVDGYSLDQKTLDSYCSWVTPLCAGRKLKPGEIGAALAHYKIWKKIKDENMPCALIFEDDAVVGEDFKKIILKWKTYPKNTGILNFRTEAKKRSGGPLIHKDYRICRFESDKFMNGLVAYFITNDTAKKLLKKAHPMRTSCDGLTSEIKGVVKYGIVPEPVHLANFSSDIWNSTS